jgi:hypothetical protein
MLHLGSLVVAAGQTLIAPLHVANDGPALSDAAVRLRFGPGAPVDLPLGDLQGGTAAAAGVVSISAPEVPGGHDLLLTLRAGGRIVAENRYPIHVVARAGAPHDVQVIGTGPLLDALARLGARVGESGPTLVAEGALGAGCAEDVAERLRDGGTVVVLAQAVEAAAHYPVPVQLAAVATAWGSSVFRFTTDSGALPSLPRRNLLVGEDSTVQARDILVRVGDAAFPSEPVVIAYKPVPDSVTGTVVGLHRVGAGRLLLCQYRLAAPAAVGDAAASALLSDLVRWAADPRPATRAERLTKDDGRALTYYSFPVAP